jgi:hypothetical protein
MHLPAARHPELGAPPVPGAKGGEQGLDLAAQMRFHTHAAAFQSQPQWFRNGRAEQHVHAEFRHAVRQRVGRQHAEEEFLSLHFPVAVPAHHQQAGGRVKHGRDAALTIGNGNQHAGCDASFVPEGTWCCKKGESPEMEAPDTLPEGPKARFGLQNATGSHGELRQSARLILAFNPASFAGSEGLTSWCCIFICPVLLESP